MKNNFSWFKDAKYGLMVHFGLYSCLEGEYKGKKPKDYAEWLQASAMIPNKEMEEVAKSFNPTCFNADEWIKFAKECGMKYFVITAKHHEGFALFKSFDKYNVVDATPFKRDIIKELSLACKKYGLKFGVYYSQDLDWHDPNGGGYKSNHIPCSGVTWDNSWDFKDETKKNYDLCYKNKIIPQIKELLTNYGEISLIWFDVPMTLTFEQSKEIYELVKKYQPNCLVNSRLGGGVYDYVTLGDNEIPDSFDCPKDVDYNDICGFKPSKYGLYESACTLNGTWGFSKLDKNFKSPEFIFNTKQKLNKMGINYLINIGPDHLGRFPKEEKEILLKVKELESR